MLNNLQDKLPQSELKAHWIIVIVMVLMLVSSLLFCHLYLAQHRLQLPAEQRELLRTIFYVVSIITLPMTNLLRHIQLRLNQTMPGEKTPKDRYFLTILVSMASVEMIGMFGLVVFWLGDGFNSLYIFTIISGLGIFLYRPKAAEYLDICEKLTLK